VSGGPVIIDFVRDPSNTFNNFINGVNAYSYNTEPNARYTPYFGNNFKDLYDAIVADGA